MQVGSIDSLSIETFRGDYHALHEMVIASWRDEYRGTSFPDIFAPDLVQMLCGPSLPPDHQLAVYDGDACVAFLVNLPRTMQLRGRRVRALLTGLLTVHKQYLRRGVAEALCRTAIALNQGTRYDISFFYVEKGHRSKALFAKLAADGLPFHPLKRVPIFARVFDLETARDSENLKPHEVLLLRLLRADRALSRTTVPGLRPYRSEDLSACVALLNAHAARVDLARLFTPDELGRLLDHPGRAETLVVERDGTVIALINWFYYQQISHNPQRWAWLSHLSFGSLTGREQRALVASFLRHIRAAGCLGVVTFNTGYASLGPFVSNGFLPALRTLTLHGCFFEGAGPLCTVRHMFDMQL